MLRCVPLLFLLAASCGSGKAHERGSTVTVTLPPPKAMPAPGFSGSLTSQIP
jgi:hypothetical protein